MTPNPLKLYRIALALLIGVVLLLSSVSLYQQGHIRFLEDIYEVTYQERMAFEGKLQQAEAENARLRADNKTTKEQLLVWPVQRMNGPSGVYFRLDADGQYERVLPGR